MAKALPILDKTFIFALFLHRKTANFDRKYKFTLGDKIDTAIESALELIVRANRTISKHKAAELIYDFCIEIDVLTLKLRLAASLGLLSDDAKAQCDMLTVEILRMANGWRKYMLRGANSVGGEATPSEESL